VLNQTYKNIEVILINDGSTDSTLDIITSLAREDKRIVNYTTQGNKGVAQSRLTGLQMAKGSYIYFLDSDDFLDERAIERLINAKGNNLVTVGKMVNATKYEKQEFIGNDEPKIYRKKRTKLFKKRSILHALIQKEILIDEIDKLVVDARHFSDLSYIARVIEQTSEIVYVSSSIYYKRLRNDPLNHPSLMQEDMLSKLQSYLTMMSVLKDRYSSKLKVKKYLDHQFLNYYRKSIVTYLKKQNQSEEIFELLVKISNCFEEKALQNKSIILKREFKPILQNNYLKYTKIMNAHNTLRDIKRAGRSKHYLYTFLYRNVFIKIQMDDKLILFESFLGKNYSDSPKYIYEELLNCEADYKYVWIFNEVGKEISGNAKQVKRFSLRYYYYLAKAKYWVSNSRIPKRFDKREGNIYLQTWHGTPLKNLVFDMRDVHSANPHYKRDFYIQSRRWDYLISPNQYSSDIFRRAFMFDKKMLEIGYPRNDVLYKKNNEDEINKLKRKMQLPLDKKVILYAPTWRDDQFYEAGKYKFNLELDLNKVRKELSEEYVVVLRMHYFIANQLDLSEYKDFAFDFSKYDDISELYLISDLLITDYSSVFFDYANLRRPILFFTYDLENYRDKLRGFYINMETDLPGPLLYNTDGIVRSIHSIDDISKKFNKKYNEFYRKFCSWDDGHAAEKTIKEVFN
ncbi:bifunctional glycosyltransferase/CDP-glycerol:glycerophosphate glycerophosphotransferase, partial [Halolactibacillus halophilus]